MIIRTPNGESIRPRFSFIEKSVGDGESVESVIIGNGEFSRELASVNAFEAVSEVDLQVGYTYENLTPLVCSIENWPLIEWVSNGLGKIKINNGKASQIYNLYFRDTANYALVPTGFVAGTAAKFTFDILEPVLIAGGDRHLFVGGPSDDPSDFYNPNCFAADFDFSGVLHHSDWGGVTRTVRGGALITPQHLIANWHYQHEIGRQLSFVSKTTPGLVITRTIVGKSRDSDPNNLPPDWHAHNDHISDRMIYTLDAPVPPSIKWYKFAGPWDRVFDDDDLVKSWVGFLGLSVDQYRNVHASLVSLNRYFETQLISPAQTVYGETIIEDNYKGLRLVNLAVDPAGFLQPFAEYYYRGVSGDSGCPSFLPISATELALLTTYKSGGGGPLFHEQVINLQIADADAHAISRGALASPTGYTVTVAPDPTL